MENWMISGEAADLMRDLVHAPEKSAPEKAEFRIWLLLLATYFCTSNSATN